MKYIQQIMILLFMVSLFSACNIYRNTKFKTISEESVSAALEFKKVVYLHSHEGLIGVIHYPMLTGDSLYGQFNLYKWTLNSCNRFIAMKERKDEHENHLHIYSKPNIRLNEGMIALSVRDFEKMVVHEKPIIVYVFAYSFIFGSVGSVLLGLFFML